MILHFSLFCIFGIFTECQVETRESVGDEKGAYNGIAKEEKGGWDKIEIHSFPHPLPSHVRFDIISRHRSSL